MGWLLISGLQEKSEQHIPATRDKGLPEMREDLLERVAEICNEEGIVVLEMGDTGEVFIAERDDDGSVVLWKLAR